jgi:carbon monoxide dehydrogenase subunit G
MLKKILPAAAFAALAATPALALEVSQTFDVPAPPAKVWAAIGDFCGIAAWHPAIETCALSTKGDAQLRTLSLKGGGSIVEQQLSRNDAALDYSYAILESPLPVADYKSTIQVTPSAIGSKVTWSGSFKAKGAEDAKAEATIVGIYRAGLQGIVDKFK